MTDDKWRLLIQDIERARAAVRASRGLDESPDTQLGPRLSLRRSTAARAHEIELATARGDVPAWVVRYAAEVMD